MQTSLLYSNEDVISFAVRPGMTFSGALCYSDLVRAFAWTDGCVLVTNFSCSVSLEICRTKYRIDDRGTTVILFYLKMIIL